MKCISKNYIINSELSTNNAFTMVIFEKEFNMVDYRENIICKLIMIVIVCIGIGICSSDTYAATDKTEQKAFFADGQTIKVYEMTVEEKMKIPEWI